LDHSGGPFHGRLPFAFFRLRVDAGDAYYLDFACVLLHNIKQGRDWDPARPMGYAYPGLQTKVGTVCFLRGHSIGNWLQWVTVGLLVPMSQLEDLFGDPDIDR